MKAVEKSRGKYAVRWIEKMHTTRRVQGKDGQLIGHKSYAIICLYREQGVQVASSAWQAHGLWSCEKQPPR